VTVEALAKVLHHSRAATPLARLVLVGIANHDGDGGAWPTVATLAKYAGVSTRSVQYAIRDLEALGEIVCHRNEGGNSRTRGNNKPNLYDVTVCCPPECDGTKYHRPRVQPASPLDDEDGPQGRLGVQEVAPVGVKAVSSKTAFEPSSKTSPPPSEQTKEQEIKAWAHDRASKYAAWYRATFNMDHPTERGDLGVAAVFAGLRRRGMSEADISETVKAMGEGALSIDRVVKARSRLRRDRQSGGERWVVPQ
jgi:Helix-turn-helix domain